jgi:acyl-CoA synthetase (AMP-forming)/AMP-acid ligase II
LFLFEDRAHSARDVNERIDNVVRGLISIGVRQGEHVGVLMGTRPSALALIAALSRLGAVAVLLRPDGNTAREASLGQVRRIIADPERAAQAAGLGTVHTFVLGGGGGSREFRLPLTTDMEQIDPHAVTMPAWYRANPGRASDLAFILFTGESDFVRMSRVTNRRWVTSAFGTASSAALSSADTVYSVTPLYHPSGLMMSIGGAIAGGARLAMASSFEPSRFWDEVRRYGVTVASYTWTLLHDLVQAPPQAGERHHPVRLFIGSGMPRGLWRRVQERFHPARVVEFYASTETGAVLVNLRSAKPGRWVVGCREAPRYASPPTTPMPNSCSSAAGDSCASARPMRLGSWWRAPIPRRRSPRCAASSPVMMRGCQPAICSVATPTATSGAWTASMTSSTPPAGRCSRRRSVTRSAICRPSIWRSPTVCARRVRPRSSPSRR